MLVDRRFLASAASILAMAVAAPAVAQTPGKDAWAQVRRLAAEAGLTITSQSVTDMGTALIANGVRIFPTEEADDLVLSMDTLQVEPRGDLIALTPAPRIGVQTRFAGGISREFEVLAPSGGEIVGALTDTQARLQIGYPVLQVRMLGATQNGARLDEAFDLTLDQFDTNLDVSREGAADVTLGAGSVRYAARFMVPDGISGSAQQSMDGSMEALSLTFSGRELDMISDQPGALRAAFDAGMEMSLRLTSGPSQGNTQQSAGGMPIQLATTAADTALEMTMREGRFDATMMAGAGSYVGGAGPVAGNVTFDGVSFNFAAPLIVTPGDQPVRYAFSFDNLTPSPELLSAVGAAPFAGDSLSMALDLGADVRLLQELGPEWGSGDVPPVEVSRFRLDNVLLRVGDSEFTGSGAVALVGGLMANIGRDMPELDGDLSFTLMGGERLLTRVQEMGVVPQDQLFVVRMMMNGLGRPMGADHLQSDWAFRPGGVITVNGAPLPF